MELKGRSLIGSQEGAATRDVFYAWNPRTNEQLQPAFYSASEEEIDQAARLAARAFATYGRLPGRERAVFLRSIAEKIEGLREELVERAHQETALPKARLEGETARTCGQLRLFAQVVEEGSWVMARIDRAQPDRKPLPRPDIRSMLRPLGPVAIFGASNFPLAFSVAGGDTASALAAGNPVVVKAHPAHPGTSELVGRAVRHAVRECNLPEGIFSLLFDSGTEVGAALIKHPLIKAGGFTGSRNGGKTLMNLAASRPDPIPFYAEMSSTNPLFILPGALKQNAEKIAAGLHASFTLGAGQFCTKPGIVFLPDGPDQSRFQSALQKLVEQPAFFHLLTEGIRSSYCSGVVARKTNSKLKLIAETKSDDPHAVGIALFETDIQSF